MGLQYRHRILADLPLRQSCRRRYLIHEVVDQFRNVLAAFDSGGTRIGTTDSR